MERKMLKVPSLQITGATKLLGVLGAPITHSFSPRIHRCWIKEAHANYLYLPFHCEARELETFLRSLQQLPCLGVNLTVPLKETALQFLDEITPEAALI